MPDYAGELLIAHTVPNWSPVADSLVLGALMDDDDVDDVSRSVDPLVQAFPEEGKDRLYVGAGHRETGAVRELRTGLKTNVTVELELEQYPPTYV
jgi:hypothetical protein